MAGTIEQAMTCTLILTTVSVAWPGFYVWEQVKRQVSYCMILLKHNIQYRIIQFDGNKFLLARHDVWQ